MSRAAAAGLALAALAALPGTAAAELQIPVLGAAPPAPFTGQAVASGSTRFSAAAQSLPDAASAKAALGLDTVYSEYQQYKTSALSAVEPFTLQQTSAQVTPDNRVVIDAVAAGDPQALRAQLQALGAEVGGSAGRLVSAQLPIEQIPALLDLPGLQSARPALAATRAGSVTSQGDAALGANTARSVYSASGAGATVGVLSDSYNCLGGAGAGVASGDLPAGGVGVVQEVSSCTGTGAADEGRAMAEIVHDVAPGAAIKFRTAYNGEADFAQGITDLKNAGANIIVDDVGYFAEPFFQDGVVAQAVDAAVAGGAVYFSAAGNSARQSYESAFRPGTVYSASGVFLGGTAHDFNPGAGVDSFQQLTCNPNGRLTVSLQWDNPYPSLGGPAPAANLDVYLFNSAQNGIYARSVSAQPPADPVEIISVDCGAATTVMNLMIVIRTGTAPSRIKYVNYGSNITVNEWDTQSPTAVGHPNAAGAIATGAAAYFLTPAYGTTPPVLNYYSSAGGVPILFQPNGTAIAGATARAKPELTAPDGGDNTFFGGDYEGNTRPNFFGTSAAAPHAAAVAALLRQRCVGLSAAQARSILQRTAVDMLQKKVGSFGGSLAGIGAGFDYDSGAGLARAANAMAACPLAPGDADGDGDIDKADLAIISRARGRSVAAGDPLDVNGDGKVDPSDVSTAIPLCTRAGCATS